MRKFTKSLLTLALMIAGVGSVNAQTTLAFDAFGKASIDKAFLVGDGGLTYNTSTGELTSDGTAGTLTLEFTDPADLRNLIYFDVVRSGDDNIVDRLKFYDEDNTLINTWNSIKLSNLWQATGIDNNATNAFIDHKPVKKLVWESDAAAAKTSLTLTITSVNFTLKTISCAKAGETQLNTLPWNKIDGSGTEKPAWNMNGTSSANYDTYYGNFSGDPDHYADLTSYSELRVYCTDNTTGFRAFFINADASVTYQKSNIDATWHETEKYYSLDLTSLTKWNDGGDEKVALKSIKSNYGPQNVTNIVVYNTPAANAPQYILTGCGMQLAETVAALADKNATCIDATGVTGITTNSVGGRTLLESANPNCLFYGTTGNGGLANTQNVITSGTCANLVLEDSYPFKAPDAFTATEATFTKTISSAGYGTMVIPFNAALASGVEAAYDLTGDDGSKVTGSDAASITANKPVLIKGVEGKCDFTASSVNIAATVDESTNGELIGTYAGTTAAADANNYVLQNGVAGLGFFLVTSTVATVKPFRAYLHTSTAARSLEIDFDGVTGISETELVKKAEDKTFYNLNGQRVAQPTKGLYIVNGKKVIFK